ncbi:MAG: divalent-cation tolerance protein CutA [Sphingobium sp.]
MTGQAVVLVYTLFGDVDVAERIGGQMVEERLAACVNIGAPCTSLYRWNGTIERAVEIPVLFKTAPDRRDALMARLAALHPYDVPAVLALSETDAVHPPFAAWVAAQ